ncbi:preprotein translocase subunit SecE [Candidatus Microgenomates bacterium]|nr:preprotein translocase subunit SecE [Candidatus Microgenomates bacterium]
MKKIISYFNEVRAELKLVTWPKRSDVIKLTLTVLLVSAIVGLYVGGVDFGLTKLLENLVAR